MKFLKYIALFVAMLSVSVAEVSANYFVDSKLDSLEVRLQASIEQNAPIAERLSILRSMYDICKITNDQMALEFCGQAIDMMNEEGYDVEMPDWMEAVADVYYEKRVYYMAMERYHQAYSMFHSEGDDVRAAYALLSVGDTYFIQNLEDMAKQIFEKADSLFSANNCMEGRCEALMKIGRTELRNYQYDKAMQLFNKSLQIAEQCKSAQLIAQGYRYMADVYDMNDDYEQEEVYLNMAVTKYRLSGDRFAMGKTYSQLGDMHFKNEDLDKAYVNYMSACNIYEGFGDIEYVAYIHNRLGRINFMQGDMKIAEREGRKALAMSRDYLWLQQEADALLLISDIHNKLGRVDSAYYYMSQYTSVSDELYQKKRSESFSELQVSLSTQEKEAQLASAEQQIQRNKTITVIIIVFSVIVALFLLYVALNFMKAKKMNTMLTKTNEEINQKNEEILHQKEIVDKVNEEVRLRNKEIEAINESINSSINYAGRIQKAMLPDQAFLKQHFADGFVYFHPREVVSGDFYWFSEVKAQKAPSLFRRRGADEDEGSKLIMAVIDCTGHGVPGAFMSMLGDAFLNQIVNLQKITEPDKILEEINNLVFTTLQQDTTENNDGMDGAIIVVDKAAHTLKYAGAKNPLILLQDGKVEKINGDLKSIGGIQKTDDRSFTCHEIDITNPTTIYIYSDGYQDQFGGQYGRKFMAKKFRDMLVELSTLPFDEQSQILYKRFCDWRGSIIQMDDTTVLGIKIS
ncbi:MAG: SpoIIE family protein phosphatase [Bacteroidales bacterium]|nr:SpoIIE family protein phosphatase [Bacteroidales bacterium]